MLLSAVREVPCGVVTRDMLASPKSRLAAIRLLEALAVAAGMSAGGKFCSLFLLVDALGVRVTFQTMSSVKLAAMLLGNYYSCTVSCIRFCEVSAQPYAMFFVSVSKHIMSVLSFLYLKYPLHRPFGHITRKICERCYNNSDYLLRISSAFKYRENCRFLRIRCL